MRISLNWIKEFVDLPKEITPEKLAHDLTMATVEVETVIDQSKNFNKMVLGKVLELKEHPNADKLKLAMTDIGQGEVKQIVCGGSNLFEGMLVVVALPGAKVKWHGQGELVELSPVKIRNQESYGMICAAEEVGLASIMPGAEGEIMNLSFSESQPGTPVTEIFELDDVIFDIDNKSLSNRPDLWGHYGIAREMAAIYDKPLKLPKIEKIDTQIKDKMKINIKSDACYRYLGTVVESIKVAPSPAWLKRRLLSIGQKSINNIVDLTNYVMFETGQPTHAFDFDRIEDQQIVVRQANDGEPLTTLDQEQVKLSKETLVISDSKKSIALAGVIGGNNSAISDKTKTIVLEAASFDSTSVRRASQTFTVRTESSIRFEKGIDTERAELAMDRMLYLIKKIIPEAKIGPTVEEYKKPTPAISINVDSQFVNSRLGRELKAEDMAKILASLQFEVKVKGEKLQVAVPVWRATGDVSLPEDIVEEIARIYGYDNLEFYPPQVKLLAAVYQPAYIKEKRLKEYLSLGAGMDEVFNYPWSEKRVIDALKWSKEKAIKIVNAPSSDNARLAVSLIPNLVKNIENNVKNYDEFRIFEVARVFLPVEGKEFSGQDKKYLPEQPKMLAGAVVGKDNQDVFRQVKGTLQGLFEYLGLGGVKFISNDKPESIFDKNRSLQISLNSHNIGYLGLLRQDIYERFDFKDKAACLFEVNLSKIITADSNDVVYKSLPKHPIVERDFSIIVSEKVEWQDVKKVVLKSSKLVSNIDLFDVYSGSKVPTGNKSLAFSVTLTADRTLAATEIDKEIDNILKKINKELGGRLRDF